MIKQNGRIEKSSLVESFFFFLLLILIGGGNFESIILFRKKIPMTNVDVKDFQIAGIWNVDNIVEGIKETACNFIEYTYEFPKRRKF